MPPRLVLFLVGLVLVGLVRVVLVNRCSCSGDLFGPSPGAQTSPSPGAEKVPAPGAKTGPMRGAETVPSGRAQTGPLGGDRFSPSGRGSLYAVDGARFGPSGGDRFSPFDSACGFMRTANEGAGSPAPSRGGVLGRQHPVRRCGRMPTVVTRLSSARQGAPAPAARSARPRSWLCGPCRTPTTARSLRTRGEASDARRKCCADACRPRSGSCGP